MWNKIFFRTLKQVKYVKFNACFFVQCSVCLFSLVSGNVFCQNETPVSAPAVTPASTSAPVSAPGSSETAPPAGASVAASTASADANARLLLGNAVQTLETAQSFAVDLRCQVQTLSAEANGRGNWCQKKTNTAGRDVCVFMRFEMMYDLEGFQQQELVVLNGEQKKLWQMQDRRRSGNPGALHSAEMSRIDLRRVEDAYYSEPKRFSTLSPPWYGQAGLDALLKSILSLYEFQVAGISEHGIQIAGTLKPAEAQKILDVRKIRAKKSKNLLFALPQEVPTSVTLYLDERTCLPYCIQFRHEQTAEESSSPDAFPEMVCTLYFENLYLNNVTQSSGYFEISDTDVNIDATESYIRSRRE